MIRPTTPDDTAGLLALADATGIFQSSELEELVGVRPVRIQGTDARLVIRETREIVVLLALEVRAFSSPPRLRRAAFDFTEGNRSTRREFSRGHGSRRFAGDRLQPGTRVEVLRWIWEIFSGHQTTFSPRNKSPECCTTPR